MSSIEGIIFDMDGCLYPLDKGSGKTFAESEFGKSIKRKEIDFVRSHLGIGQEEAIQVTEEIKVRHNRHLSLGLERERGIPRDEFFAYTWDLDPKDFIDPQKALPDLLAGIALRKAVLTAAPGIWADRTLTHLGVRSLFAPHIVSGDQDIRKPDPQAFLQVADMLEIDNPRQIIAIGDQEHTDIAPAQSLGMLTVKIGGAATKADFLARGIMDAINQLTKEGLV